MYQAVDPWREPDGKFVQWGSYRISANTLDERSDNFYFIASVSNVSDVSQNEANARLIAAAPELLRTLQNLVSDYDNAVESHSTTHIDSARAAIAAALGDA